MKRRKKFIPALKFDWLTRLFDPLMKLTFIEQKLRNDFLEQVNIKDNETILDFGCGTGTLAIMAKRKSPNAKICGVDVDFNILKIASNKTKKEDCKISLQSYDGISLPYEDETFDKVI
ncbi:MAG TPA: methyltransferase domain-containing protein [Thermoanaerobacterales bacterium]|nr:methyltransferase domain-containing protein [Thermoanaerobacterales bacterium]